MPKCNSQVPNLKGLEAALECGAKEGMGQIMTSEYNIPGCNFWGSKRELQQKEYQL